MKQKNRPYVLSSFTKLRHSMESVNILLQKVGENMFEDIRDMYGMGYGYHPLNRMRIIW